MKYFILKRWFEKPLQASRSSSTGSSVKSGCPLHFKNASASEKGFILHIHLATLKTREFCIRD
ncbi:MAG TPA: hypothetical protein DCG37_03710 [Lachnospiraceae bacterium]|nr:hypothetical protein [Lachnospiraceae bacterium]